ncbi:MAG: imidazole glycerol phosphate synthase cyclase subunit [Candidatus Peribacteraceae bacterium]|nr:imidazole glycerol phosphate synthase cyclase subunit [Candidatus Peribacteraceae bacterium]
MKIRIIPRLDVKGPTIVKGIHMEGLRVVGKPQELARKYYEQGADELVIMDTVASLYGRSPDFDLMRSVANELFIPLTMGGGIQSLHDITNFLRSGADKVAINTFATRNPQLIPEAVRQFGSQCIVLSVEAKRVGPPRPSGGLPAEAPRTRGEGWWEAYTEGGREHSGRNALEWIKEALDLGIGEILLTSVDFDGTRKGYDLELIRAVTSFATVPVVAHGGARDAQSLHEALDAKADAVALASILHYDENSIQKLKQQLKQGGIPVRLP